MMKIEISFKQLKTWWQKKQRLVFVVAALVVLTVAGTVTTDASSDIRSDGVINVKTFGAVGNGLTNDTSAINSAIAALPATNGCLFFPPGNYLTSGSHLFSNHTNLLVIGLGATILQNTPANNTFGFDNTNSNVRVTGLTFDTPIYYTSDTPNTIGTGHKTFTVATGLNLPSGNIIRATSRAAGDYVEGAVTSYSGTSLILNCAVTVGNGTHTDWDIGPGRAHGIHIRMNCGPSQIDHCTIRKSSDFGLFFTDTDVLLKNVVVTDCFFDRTIGDGVHLSNVDGFLVANNRFYRTGDDAIAPLGGALGGGDLCQNGIVANNVIIGGGPNLGFRGIAIQCGKYIKVTGNYIYATRGAAIEIADECNTSFYNDSIMIENNLLYSTLQLPGGGPLASLIIMFAKNCSVRGNVIVDPYYGSAIGYADVQGLDISGNTITQRLDQFCRGINVSGSTSYSGRNYAAIWDDVKIVNNTISMLSVSNSECIYLAPAPSVAISNIIIAGNNCRNVRSGNYIYTDYLGAAAKIVNNTCLETRTISNGGHGLSPITVNNN